MVSVEMAHDDRFNIFDVVSSLLDCSGKFLILTVLGAWEDVGDWGTPFLHSPSLIRK
jgi:hypothetical protein